MTEFRRRWGGQNPADTMKNTTDKTDKRPFVSSVRSFSEGSASDSPTCERCGGPLRLPESVQLGVCCRCMTEAEWVDTLARMVLRREATKRAVERRKAELRKEAA